MPDATTPRQELARYAHDRIPEERRRNAPDLDLDPETAREVAEYFEANKRDRPWLRKAIDQPQLVQFVYLQRDLEDAHDLRRHEGWRSQFGPDRRVGMPRDPAHAKTGAEYLRAEDAYGNGRLHHCDIHATQIPDPIAYTTVVARLHNDPRIREAALDAKPTGKRPKDIEIPTTEVLGTDGHRQCKGAQLVGDDIKLIREQRLDWARAIREEIDAGAEDSVDAIAKVRARADRDGLVEPQTEPIPTFEGGTVTVKFTPNADRSGYRILTFFPEPPDPRIRRNPEDGP